MIYPPLLYPPNELPGTPTAAHATLQNAVALGVLIWLVILLSPERVWAKLRAKK